MLVCFSCLHVIKHINKNTNVYSIVLLYEYNLWYIIIIPIQTPVKQQMLLALFQNNYYVYTQICTYNNKYIRCIYYYGIL